MTKFSKFLGGFFHQENKIFPKSTVQSLSSENSDDQHIHICSHLMQNNFEFKSSRK